jgi:hypothetical protein
MTVCARAAGPSAPCIVAAPAARRLPPLAAGAPRWLRRRPPSPPGVPDTFPLAKPLTPIEAAAKSNLLLQFAGIEGGKPYTPPNRGGAAGTATRYCFRAFFNSS